MTNAPRGCSCSRRVVPAQSQPLAGSFATVLTVQVAVWHGSGARHSHSLVFLERYQHKAAATCWRFRPSMNNGTGLVTLLCAKRSLPENSPPAVYLHHIQLYRHLSTINISVQNEIQLFVKLCQALLTGAVCCKSPALQC